MPPDNENSEDREHENSAVTLGMLFRYAAVGLGGAITVGGVIVSVVLYLASIQTTFATALSSQKSDSDTKIAFVTQQVSNLQLAVTTQKESTAAAFEANDKERVEIRNRRDGQVSGLDTRVTNLEKLMNDMSLTLARMDARGEQSNKMLQDLTNHLPGDHKAGN